MTAWLARKTCALDEWWSARRGRTGWLKEQTASADSKRKAAEGGREDMMRQLAGVHLAMAAIIRANGGRVRVERRHFGQVHLDEFIIVTEDASHRTFKLERREPQHEQRAG